MRSLLCALVFLCSAAAARGDYWVYRQVPETYQVQVAVAVQDAPFFGLCPRCGQYHWQFPSHTELRWETRVRWVETRQLVHEIADPPVPVWRP
jgi:hypothetical protein